jgi:hypothetical protein
MAVDVFTQRNNAARVRIRGVLVCITAKGNARVECEDGKVRTIVLDNVRQAQP